MALVLMMVLAMAGCATAVPTASAPQATADGATAAPSDEATVAPTATPLPEVELSYYMLMGTQQPDQDLVFEACNKYIKEKINATVKFTPWEWGNFEDKMKTMIAVNDPFDIAWTASWASGSIAYPMLAQNGNLLALDDLLDQYAPNAKAAIPSQIWDLAKVNGKLYCIPNYQIMISMGGMWVKKDLADKYGFDITTFKNVRDLEPFFATLKANEPTITPIVPGADFISWFGAGYGPETDLGRRKWLNNTYCYVFFSDPKTVVCETDQVIVDATIAQCTLARDWYVKGYQRKDLFSVQDSDAEIKTGNYAVGFGTYSPSWAASLKNDYGFDVYTCPIDKDASITSGSATATALAVSAGTKYPERCVMLMELFNSDKYLYNTICYGIEGTHYTKVDDSNITVIENSGYAPGMEWAMGNTFNCYFLPGKSQELNDATLKLNADAVVEVMPGFVANTDSIKNEVAAMTAIWNEVAIPLRSGVTDGDIAELVAKYCEKMEKAGMSTVKAEMQKQVDAWWASQK